MHLLNDHTIISFLKELGVYVTQNRIVVLKVLMQCPGAVSVATIRKLAEVKLDRVSVYRTLQSFLDKGLLLVIPNVSGIPHYTLIGQTNFEKRDGSAFFICTRCGTAALLPGKIKVKHPPSFDQRANTIRSRYIVLEGLCNKCQP